VIQLPQLAVYDLFGLENGHLCKRNGVSAVTPFSVSTPEDS